MLSARSQSWIFGLVAIKSLSAVVFLKKYASDSNGIRQWLYAVTFQYVVSEKFSEGKVMLFDVHAIVSVLLKSADGDVIRL